MRVMPRQKPGVAVRVQKEIIADVGEWLVIGDDDSVWVMTDDAFRAAYQSNGDATPDPKITKSVGPKGGVLRPKRIASATIFGAGLRVGAQDVRVLHYLCKSGQATTTVLRSAIAAGHPDNEGASAAISRLLKNGLVARNHDMQSVVTEKGIELLSTQNVASAFAVVGMDVP